MKRILFAVLFMFILLVMPKSAFAANLNVDCNLNPVCSKSGIDPLFPSSEVWFPGKTATKTFNIKNSSSDNRTIAMLATKTSEGLNLQTVINLTISKSGGPIIWAGTLGDFYSASEIALGTLNSGSNQDFDIVASMDQSAGNEYQNRNSVFNLTFGFTGNPPIGGSPGGGTSPASPPVCNDTAPKGAPVLLSAVSNNSNQVTLVWSPAADPVTYYLVAFGTTPGNPQYGNPNVGGNGTTTYSVNGLSGGQIYYFRVRAGNGCAPGPFSNELSVFVGGIVILTPPAGFEENVLGEQKESSDSAKDESGLDGDQGGVDGLLKVGPTCSFWPLVPLIQLILTIFYLYTAFKTAKKPGYWWLGVPGLAFLAYFLFNILSGSMFGDKEVCSALLPMILGAMGLPSIFYFIKSQQS